MKLIFLLQVWQMVQRKLELIEVIATKEPIRKLDTYGKTIFAITQGHRMKVMLRSNDDNTGLVLWEFWWSNITWVVSISRLLIHPEPWKISTEAKALSPWVLFKERFILVAWTQVYRFGLKHLLCRKSNINNWDYVHYIYWSINPCRS